MYLKDHHYDRHEMITNRLYVIIGYVFKFNKLTYYEISIEIILELIGGSNIYTMVFYGLRTMLIGSSAELGMMWRDYPRYLMIELLKIR